MPTLETWPDPIVRLACSRCDRWGRYRRADLIARWGPDKPMDLVRAQIVGNCHAGSGCGAHYVVSDPGRPDWMTAGQLAAELRKQVPHLPALIGGAQLLPVRQVRVVGVDMRQPVRMRHYGAPVVIIVGE